MPYTIPNASDAAFAAQAAVDAVDLGIITAGSGLNGVLTGCAASVTGSNMVVSIAAGQAIVNGMPVTVGAGSVTVTTANATLERFDLISVNASGTLAITAGTAAANPVFPSAPANSAVLYAVYVPAADTSIQSNQLVDKRVTVRVSDEHLVYTFF